MITFKRYPHVRDLIVHYATTLQDDHILSIMNDDVTTTADATALAKFIWKMADEMAKDNENKAIVLGSTDNSDMIPDVDYEISLLLGNKGYGEIWDRVCDES